MVSLAIAVGSFFIVCLTLLLQFSFASRLSKVYLVSICTIQYSVSSQKEKRLVGITRQTE